MALGSKTPACGPGFHISCAELVAPIYQPPARSPRGRDKAPNVAAAIAGAVKGWSANHHAGTAPAVPSMPTVAAEGGGRGGCQRRRSQRRRGNCNKREFA